VKFLFLTLSLAHAGWWADFCEKHLVAEDPYQYEQTSTEWLDREIAKYQIKEAWGKLDNQEKTHLRILLRERNQRENHL
jgi:hypothetical protein